MNKEEIQDVRNYLISLYLHENIDWLDLIEYIIRIKEGDYNKSEIFRYFEKK